MQRPKLIKFEPVYRVDPYWTPERDAQIMKWSDNPEDEDGSYHWLSSFASLRVQTLTFERIIKKMRPYWVACLRGRLKAAQGRKLVKK